MKNIQSLRAAYQAGLTVMPARLYARLPDGEACPPGRFIDELLREGKLRRFVKWCLYQPVPGRSVGAQMGVALMLLDLIDAGAAGGWSWIKGTIERGNMQVAHGWLEYDEWVIDVSGGCITICDSAWYRKRAKAAEIARCDAGDFEPWLAEVAQELGTTVDAIRDDPVDIGAARVEERISARMQYQMYKNFLKGVVV